MKILVTGSSGMLGRDLIAKLAESFDVYGLSIDRDPRPKFSQCDITDRIATIKCIERVNPKLVIHAAAMTDVDACENNRQTAMRVNFEGTKNVVDGARHVKAMLIYISTDFVFSGAQQEPYRETKIPHPINVYGESKLLGEFYVREQSSRFLILRTAWLYGLHGNNFMQKILQRAKESAKLFVVQDQKGNPTYTRDLAKAIHELIQKMSKDAATSALNAVYHMTNRGTATRYEVACELIKLSGLQDIEIMPIDSVELKNLAKRPHNSALDGSRLERTFNISLRPWQEALHDYCQELK